MTPPPVSRARRGRFAVSWLFALVLCTTVLSTPAHAAPTRPPGPALQTPTATLNRALVCTSNIGRTPGKPAVLLIHGTGATPDVNFSWNYYSQLRQRGYAYCTVRIPDRGLGDLQVNVEYVVHAIRAVRQRSGAKIAVIGHSQGAFLPSYALKVWPDLAAKVDDFISYAGVESDGTLAADVLCLLSCSQAFQQFRPSSNLMRQLAKRPLPSGPSYTAYQTRFDEIVLPQPSASTFHGPGARNYVLQDICPLDVAEHLSIIAERPLFQLTFDALTHRGPGRLDRIKPTCGFDPQVIGAVPVLPEFGIGAATDYTRLLADREPPLRAYWSR